jgi:prevent-host-death family protein
MHTWQLQEAKSRFSELVELTLKEDPQLVTRCGEDAVVILAANDYRRLSDQKSRLKDSLLSRAAKRWCWSDPGSLYGVLTSSSS